MAKINRRSKQFKRNKIAMSSLSLSNGEFKPLGVTPKRYAIERASDNLRMRGYMPEKTVKPTTDRMAFEMMHAIGYTIEVGQQDLTLIDETPEEPQLFETNYTATEEGMNMVTQNIDMLKSFANQNDPIYQTDDNPPFSLQTQGNFIPLGVAETLDLVSSGRVLGSTGMRPTKLLQTSRYFNNQEVSQTAKRMNT
tara:strand:- start:96 stop:680 length:585 start_codon:yes stop_codon:yes gene_type:complete